MSAFTLMGLVGQIVMHVPARGALNVPSVRGGILYGTSVVYITTKVATFPILEFTVETLDGSALNMVSAELTSNISGLVISKIDTADSIVTIRLVYSNQVPYEGHTRIRLTYADESTYDIPVYISCSDVEVPAWVTVPPSLSFMTTTVGARTSGDLIITNASPSLAVSIKDIWLLSDTSFNEFTLESEVPIAIASGESSTIKFSFSPLVNSYRTTLVVIETEQNALFYCTLLGYGANTEGVIV